MTRLRILFQYGKRVYRGSSAVVSMYGIARDTNPFGVINVPTGLKGKDKWIAVFRQIKQHATKSKLTLYREQRGTPRRKSVYVETIARAGYKVIRPAGKPVQYRINTQPIIARRPARG